MVGVGVRAGRRHGAWLLASGAEVTVADLNAEKARRLPRALGARFVACDVTDGSQVESAVAAAGPLRMSVCCAGIGWAEKTAVEVRSSHALDPFESVAADLIGTFNVLRFVASAMLANDPDAEGERGVCISTASIAAFDGQIGQLAYSASKGGIVGMTLPAARDLAQSGVRGRDRARAVRYAAPGGPPRGGAERAGEQVPHPHRLGRPEEYGDLRRPHRREPDAQRRGHQARRRVYAAAVAPWHLVESQWLRLRSD